LDISDRLKEGGASDGSHDELGAEVLGFVAEDFWDGGFCGVLGKWSEFEFLSGGD